MPRVHPWAMARPPIFTKRSEAEDEVLKRLWSTSLTITAIAPDARSHHTVRMNATKRGLPPKDNG